MTTTPPESSVDEPAPGAVAHHAERRLELTLEISTMALYVSVVLFAALVALEDGATTSDREILGLIWVAVFATGVYIS